MAKRKEPEKPSFDPMIYLTTPCPFRIGSEERMLVQEKRAAYIRPLVVEGDCIIPVEAFKERKVMIREGWRTGRIHPRGQSLAE